MDEQVKETVYHYIKLYIMCVCLYVLYSELSEKKSNICKGRNILDCKNCRNEAARTAWQWCLAAWGIATSTTSPSGVVLGHAVSTRF